MFERIQSTIGARRGRKLTVAALATLLVVGSVQAAGNDGNVIAAGSGHVAVEGGQRTFTFVAVEASDGSVRGQSLVRNPATGVRSLVAVDCAVVLGNLAVMSGVVTQSNVPEIVGFTVVWAVLDNGEGPGDPPDEITQVFGVTDEPVAIPDLCLIVVEDPELFALLLSELNPIQNGNVQVF